MTESYTLQDALDREAMQQVSEHLKTLNHALTDIAARGLMVEVSDCWDANDGKGPQPRRLNTNVEPFAPLLGSLNIRLTRKIVLPYPSTP